MSIAGETIDYGPCAFMDSYHPATVYSSIDSGGRYAYGNQPRIANWNLSRLAGAMLTLLNPDETAAIAEARAALDSYPSAFEGAWRAGLVRKLGLAERRDGDDALATELLDAMAQGNADFTLTFRGLSDAAAVPDGAQAVRSLFQDPERFDSWSARWRARLDQEGRDGAERAAAMRLVNPAFIPRNHLVEAAIRAAETETDYAVLDRLLSVLAHPYEDQPENARFVKPPLPHEIVRQTFCGT
jgi:uncharacterized protein YdiU (UPF0061 family)